MSTDASSLLEKAVNPAVSPEVSRQRLELSRDLLHDLEARAAEGYPYEVCGLLLGRREAAGWRLESSTQGGNLVVDRQEDRYILDPAHYLEADRTARQQGFDIIGVWHTHPDHPAVPSVTDRDHAWNDFVYLILPTRREGTGEGRAYVLADGDFLEITVEITVETTAETTAKTTELESSR